MAESPIALLRAHSRHAPWNARGLAAHVTALVDAAGVRPTNASARAAPSARAIRFYVANGLLERPEGTGTAAYTGCAGQGGKTGTTDNFTDAWFAGVQPNLATVVWVGYPQSNAIEMTSVHGITVYGGTFPAEIWHSLYAGAEVPCEEFHEPKTPISWAPYFGRFTAAAPSGGVSSAGGEGGAESEAERLGREATGGYDPNAYAPGVGQEPTPVPPPPPYGSGGGANVGSGAAASGSR